MKISLNLTSYSWPSGSSRLAGELAAVAAAADESGIDTLWVSDHLLQLAPGAPADGAMLEAYATLGFLAGHCERVRLGTMVTAATYRAPALLVKAVTTIDVLSGGRAWLGVGAGYHEQEAATMGLDLPPVKQRFERLEATLKLALAMWSGSGTPLNSPQALTRPHPPVLIGGMGERRTLRLVAQYGDACNLFDIPDGGATVRRKLDVLARHCDELGRPFGDIEKTISSRWNPDEPVAELAERLATLERLGLDHAVLITDEAWSPRAIRSLAPLLAAP